MLDRDGEFFNDLVLLFIRLLWKRRAPFYDPRFVSVYFDFVGSIRSRWGELAPKKLPGMPFWRRFLKKESSAIMWGGPRLPQSSSRFISLIPSIGCLCYIECKSRHWMSNLLALHSLLILFNFVILDWNKQRTTYLDALSHALFLFNYFWGRKMTY